VRRFIRNNIKFGKEDATDEEVELQLKAPWCMTILLIQKTI
jgi:ABC-type multidrug transport system fused ATPase/permease subunit